MFRSAKLRESDLAEHRFAAHMDHWKWTADKWFDGTVASVDERIAKMDNVIRFARDVTSRLGSTGAGFLCGNALPNLEQSRRELAAVRDSLLNGFSDRQVSVPAGRRTASTQAEGGSLWDMEGGLQRAIVLGSRDFVADQNTEDHDELILRAQRYAAEETSTLPIPMARQLAAAFVGAVEELIAKRPRKRQAARPITHYEDFSDSLLY